MLDLQPFIKVRTSHRSSAWRQTLLACSLPLLLHVTPLLGQLATTSDAPEIVVTRDISYRMPSVEKCRLDLAIPHGFSDARPAIVVIHGGGWIEGDKSSFTSNEQGVPGNIVDFAKLGFVAATVNYRLAGDAPYPAALDDCREAVRFLRAQARQFHIDPNRMGLYGNSAGGHLALLVGMTETAPTGADSNDSRPSFAVQAIASDSGPLDLARQHQQNQLRVVIDKFLNGPPAESLLATYRAASPTYHVVDKLPPLLLVYGVNDEQVDIRTADEFVTALAQAGNKDVTYLRLAGVGHCPHSLQRVAEARAAVDEFFVKTLRP